MEGVVDKARVVYGGAEVPLSAQDGVHKDRHLKLTFQPMVGGIRKTVYKSGVSGLEVMFQKLCDIIPDGYALRFDVKIIEMSKDSYLRQFALNRVTESKFDANQKIGNQLAEMCKDDKENKV